MASYEGKNGVQAQQADLHSAPGPISHWVNETEPKIMAAYKDARSGMHRALEGVSAAVREHPVGAVALGFGLGCLAGYLTRVGQKST